MQEYQKRIRTSELLSESFSIFFANFSSLLAIVFICAIPALLAVFFQLILLFFQIIDADFFSKFGLLSFAVLLSPFSFLASGAMIFFTSESMNHRHPTVLRCLQVGVSSMSSILMVSFVYLLIVFGGMLLFCIPGMIYLAQYYASVPVAVMEKTNVSQSLQRSDFLTDGYRWQIFIAVIVLEIGDSFFKWVIEKIVVLYGSILPESQTLILSVVFTVIFTLVITMVKFLLPAVIYLKLREAKEGLNIEEIANVFR